MPRQPFTDRHQNTSPPTAGPATVDALVALHHPVRRRLYETLSGYGPAPVGRLARRCGVAAGSASHHLGVLHRAGWVQPASAPSSSVDARESWWSACHKQLSWDSDEYPPDTGGRAVLELAAREQAAHEFRAVLAWMDEADELPPEWSRAAPSTRRRRDVLSFTSHRGSTSA